MFRLDSRNRNRQHGTPQFSLDLDALSVYINVFHGHPVLPGLFESNLRLGKPIQLIEHL